MAHRHKYDAHDCKFVDSHTVLNILLKIVMNPIPLASMSFRGASLRFCSILD